MNDPHLAGRQLLRRVAAEYRAGTTIGWSSNGPGLYADGMLVPLNPPKSKFPDIKLACIDVALLRFSPEYPIGALKTARRLLKVELRGGRHAIWAFNDTDGRTVDEVITCLESAATRPLPDTMRDRLVAWFANVVRKASLTPIPAIG